MNIFNVIEDIEQMNNIPVEEVQTCLESIESDLKELDSQINRWLGELRKDIRNGKNAN